MIIKIETDCMIEAGHMIEIKVIIGTIRILEEGTVLEMIGIEVNIIHIIEEHLRTDTDHTIEAKVEIETIKEDPVGVDLEKRKIHV